jgi:large conductance mechanosensitive channel
MGLQRSIVIVLKIRDFCDERMIYFTLRRLDANYIRGYVHIKRRTHMKIFKEFKEFAMRGNVLDLAVGIIIGGSFGKVVSSMVSDVLMPPIGVLMGGVDFGFLGVTLREATNGVPAAILRYGVFINHLIDFTIVAFAVFLLIKGVNRIKRAETPPPAAPTTKNCSECAMAIPIEAKRCGHCTSVVK